MIPLADPVRDIAAYRAEILGAVTRVIESGPYILGDEVIAFETAIAELLGVSNAVGVASGTDALALALQGLGVGKGDEVITVSHTAGPTVAAIRMIDAVPVLVDIEAASYALDPDGLETAIGRKTKAIIAVHLYGHPADMERIMEIARRRGVPVLEDCAQAQGATINGQPVGSFGDAGAFSFYPTKILGAIGDGGLVATRIPDVAKKVAHLRTYGWTQPQFAAFPFGRCSRLDPIQAAVLRVRLGHVEAEIAQRQTLAKAYNEAFADLPLTLPAERAGAKHVFHLYVVRSDRRDELMEYLKRAGVMTGLHYPHPIHRQPGLAEGARIPAPLSVTERIGREILTLPMFPTLTRAAQDIVISAVRAFFQEK